MTDNIPPPPPSDPTIPAWAMYAGGAVIALVAAGFGFGWFGGGGGDANPSSGGPLVTFGGGGASSSTTLVSGSTSTSDGSTTTTTASDSTTTSSGGTSTTSSSTTTSSTTTTSTTTTTTQPAVLLEEKFDSTTTAQAMFADQYMTATVASGALRIEGKYPGVLPVMYPDPYPDSSITMWFLAEPHNVNSFYGALVQADDPDDGLERYLLVYVKPTAYTVGVSRFDPTVEGNPFVDDTFVDIPPGVAFTTREWHKMTIYVYGNSVDVFLNDVFALTWTGAIAPLDEWWWGPMIIPGEGVNTSGSPDVMLVDNVKVLPLG